MIRVAVVDDQSIILNGLQKILADAPEIAIIGMYQQPATFLDSLVNEVADVAIVDI